MPSTCIYSKKKEHGRFSQKKNPQKNKKPKTDIERVAPTLLVSTYIQCPTGAHIYESFNFIYHSLLNQCYVFVKFYIKRFWKLASFKIINLT